MGIITNSETILLLRFNIFNYLIKLIINSSPVVHNPRNLSSSLLSCHKKGSGSGSRTKEMKKPMGILCFFKNIKLMNTFYRLVSSTTEMHLSPLINIITTIALKLIYNLLFAFLASCIQFILQQPTINFTCIKFYTPFWL